MDTDDPKRANIVALLEQARKLDRPADAFARGQVLDELQDAVGLAGKMVTDRDILTRAERIAAGG